MQKYAVFAWDRYSNPPTIFYPGVDIKNTSGVVNKYAGCIGRRVTLSLSWRHHGMMNDEQFPDGVQEKECIIISDTVI